MEVNNAILYQYTSLRFEFYDYSRVYLFQIVQNEDSTQGSYNVYILVAHVF